ncbi:putative glycolipid-binding domain-containing protein [Allorhizocola rhizosphaerae]|uniref:putative glycolipid-binding domain-containing protein n=1 Tax=Allorhizocola rhizosphaerae TaxID=1872709 RepID=UPI000E3D1E13|nr:putative glycolipid-binding domain-containing protein [Allorhizocola rhizosphaerae]
MQFAEPPRQAAWEHREARIGCEVTYFRRAGGGGWRIEGSTSAVEAGVAWSVEYRIDLDPSWTTRAALVSCMSAAGRKYIALSWEHGWLIDGVHRPDLDGCFDVDLEASAMTNTFPVRRLGLALGQQSSAPAVYVRVPDLTVMRLEQEYSRVDSLEYDYHSLAFDFSCRLVYDDVGLVLDYPGIARRIPCGQATSGSR